MNTAAIDSAAARAQAFQDMPVTEVPIVYLRDMLRDAQTAVDVAIAQRDILAAIVRIRELEGIDRTRQIIAKFYP
jgi:hypothetical protein